MKSCEDILKLKELKKQKYKEYEYLLNQYLKIDKLIDKNITDNRRYSNDLDNVYICRYLNRDNLIDCTVMKTECHKKNTLFLKCKCKEKIKISESEVNKVKRKWTKKFHQNPVLLLELERLEQQ